VLTTTEKYTNIFSAIFCVQNSSNRPCNKSNKRAHYSVQTNWNNCLHHMHQNLHLVKQYINKTHNMYRAILSMIGSCTFLIVEIRNALPGKRGFSTSVDLFQYQLKTFLFQWFSVISTSVDLAVVTITLGHYKKLLIDWLTDISAPPKENSQWQRTWQQQWYIYRL